jgi:hypothetical protein
MKEASLMSDVRSSAPKCSFVAPCSMLRAVTSDSVGDLGIYGVAYSVNLGARNMER